MPPKPKVPKVPKAESIETQFAKLECCANCRFAKSIGDESHFCRRFPPKLVDQNESGDFVCEHPIVMDSDWCGEHKWRAQ